MNGAEKLTSAPSNHVRIHIVTFRDNSDRNDYLVIENMEWCYSKMHLPGQIFILENVPDGNAFVIISEHPSYAEAFLDVDEGKFSLLGEYPYAVAHLPYIEVAREIRKWYRRVYKGDPGGKAYIMSNTWGDRSCDTALCHDFIMRELDMAKKLGVDIMQLDDGWQRGITSNSKLGPGVLEGFYDADEHFWEVHEKKFPESLYPIAKKAAENDVTLGLWFAPDSSDSFSNIDRDIETLSRLHREFGAVYFKLDSVKLHDRIGEKRYLTFFDALSQADGGSLTFNLDITADHRLGHWFHREYGTLFVENRYTDWGCYFPYRTLRNLWMLSRYIPSVKMQFEVLNPRRNPDEYGDDPVAPINYDMDYLFAIVMTANPLIWMEMQHLAPADQDALADIISVYRSYVREMYPCDCEPIGDEPDGHNFSGFHLRGNGYGHLILFRDVSDCDSHTFDIPGLPVNAEFTSLHSNAEYTFAHTENSVTVSFSKERAYLWLRYKV